jgi:penicillin-binding protein 2
LADRDVRSSRFLPPDPRVVEPYRLTPRLALRLGILGAVALGLFAVLFLRLWALQVLSGEQYLRAAQNNQLRTIRVEAPRGVIRDRKGRVLVANIAGTALQLLPSDLPEKGRYQMIQRLARIVGVPATEVAREVDERKHDPLNPVVVKERLTRRELFYLRERRREFAGIMFVQSYLRQYKYRNLAAHVLGHVGEVTEDQLEQRDFAGLRPGDKVGQAGVEAAFDRYLRGTAGSERVRVDSLGQPRSDREPQKAAIAGNDIRLTLDLDLQFAAERALERGIRIAIDSQCTGGCWNANGGAIVALDARNGEVLAMASSPTYDPNIFVGNPNPWRIRPLVVEAAAKRRNYPGLNRAIAGVYPAGSTFKPVTAIAALEEHLEVEGQRVTPYTALQCSPNFIYQGEDGRPYPFRNWNPFVNTPITMPIALAWSCDTYFYRLGVGFYELESSPLQKWSTTFGFGEPSGIELGPEAAGLIPTPEWRQEYFDDEIEKLWKPGDSIELTIGQGEMTVTPLQLARFYAMVANGGRLVTPHVFDSVEGPGSVSIVPRPTQPVPKRIDVSPGALQVVREGLYRATHDPDGTSTGIFGSFPVQIAGKTGTAEKYSSEYNRYFDQAWWCGYGPAEAAEIVVCALIENGGHGGTSAAPAAREVLARYFNVEAEPVSIVPASETD